MIMQHNLPPLLYQTDVLALSLAEVHAYLRGYDASTALTDDNAGMRNDLAVKVGLKPFSE